MVSRYLACISVIWSLGARINNGAKFSRQMLRKAIHLCQIEYTLLTAVARKIWIDQSGFSRRESFVVLKPGKGIYNSKKNISDCKKWKIWVANCKGPHTICTVNVGSTRDYIIAQDILAFLLVLTYDLLEERRTIDVIITKFFPLYF